MAAFGVTLIEQPPDGHRDAQVNRRRNQKTSKLPASARSRAALE
jgi:hypothetical protein